MHQRGLADPAFAIDDDMRAFTFQRRDDAGKGILTACEETGVRNGLGSPERHPQPRLDVARVDGVGRPGALETGHGRGRLLLPRLALTSGLGHDEPSLGLTGGVGLASTFYQ